MRVYIVDRYATQWGVYDSHGVFVVGPFTTKDLALNRADYMNSEARRRATERRRPCMCCGSTFLSEGIHNRLCDTCQRGSRQMVG